MGLEVVGLGGVCGVVVVGVVVGVIGVCVGLKYC